MRTRRDFGLDWRYANNCSVGNHNTLPVTPDHSARLRQATVITIPDGASTTFQDKVIEFFESAAASDLAVPTQSLCPYCADGLHETLCDWTLLQWTVQTAPDRIFFRSSGVFRGLHDQPMSPSMTFTMGASYSLVGVSYHLALGAGPRNHFVSQVRLRGRWHRYDCMQGGVVTSADAYDAAWHPSSVHMLVYLKSSMCVATPGVYELPAAHLRQPQRCRHHSPSGAHPPQGGPADSGATSPSGQRHRRHHSPSEGNPPRDSPDNSGPNSPSRPRQNRPQLRPDNSGPTSPSGPRQHRPQLRQRQPISPSGRTS